MPTASLSFFRSDQRGSRSGWLGAAALAFAMLLPLLPGQAQAQTLYRPTNDFTIQPNLEVRAIAKDSDGNLLVGGMFTAMDGDTDYRGLARFLWDDVAGEYILDSTFTPWFDDPVEAIAIQPDGKIVVGGWFNWVRGTGDATSTSNWALTRLNADGTLDTDFIDAGNAVRATLPVRAIDIQADGKIVAVGSFLTFDGQPHRGITRVNPDGSVDTSFNPGRGTNDHVRDVKIQPDGKILIAGDFTRVHTWTGASAIHRWGIARLNENGSVDTTFNTSNAAGTQHGVNALTASVQEIALQDDGKVVLVGGFRQFNDETHRGIARLNPNGSIESLFEASTDWWVRSVALQPDGKILAGGSFNNAGTTAHDAPDSGANRVSRERLARFNEDGTLDTDFALVSGNNGAIYEVLPNEDGTIWIGGTFTQSGGVPRVGLALLDELVLEDGEQIITFPAQDPSGHLFAAGETFSLNPAATASSGLPVAYSSLTAAVCTVDATTGVVTQVAAGICTIAANQDGDDDFEAAPEVTQSVTLFTNAQTIAFPPLDDITWGDDAGTPDATATSGLPVTYGSATPHICTVTPEGVITPVSAGECQVTADQEGSAPDGFEYAPAPQVVQSFTIRAAFAGTTTPVPGLGHLSLLLLAGLLGAAAIRQRRNA